jgi:hypothetical protein
MVCGLSVVRGYHRLQRYNLHSIVNPLPSSPDADNPRAEHEEEKTSGAQDGEAEP